MLFGLRLLNMESELLSMIGGHYFLCVLSKCLKTMEVKVVDY
jgi:hypothetical protein